MNLTEFCFNVPKSLTNLGILLSHIIMIEANNVLCFITLFVVVHHAVSSDPCFTILISQNHRMVEVGRDIWMSSSPTLLLKQGHLGQVTQDHARSAFEYLQGWRLHNLSGQPDSNLLASRLPSIYCNYDKPFITVPHI